MRVAAFVSIELPTTYQAERAALLLSLAGWDIDDQLAGPTSARQLSPVLNVVVSSPLPAPCHRAMSDAALGLIQGAACSDELDALPRIVASVVDGLVAISQRVASISAQAPRLTERQAEVVDALLLGDTNHRIARRMHISEATVKRELASIGRALTASGRSELIASACRFGFQSHPRDGKAHVLVVKRPQSDRAEVLDISRAGSAWV